MQMFKLSLAALTGAAILTSASALAQTTPCTECGGTPPPTVVCRIKGNAGVGNGPEMYKFEAGDCDPGNSALHNQAYKNADKPKSPASGNR
jgi:hypothetical protein